MEQKQEPFWLVAVVLPLLGVFAWLCRPREFDGLIVAGIAWLISMRQGYEGGRRAVPVCGLVLLAAIAGLVVWVRSGA
jgi:hypothetical protein